MVRPVTLEDVVGIERYESMRDEFRRRTIEIKKHRRVSVGNRITLVFENHETVLFQIQEMIRAERIVDLDRVRDEIAVYNELIPGPGELSATLLIELEDSTRVRDELPKFYGLDQATWLELDGVRVDGVFEGGRAREDKVSAVQYVRFPLRDKAPLFAAAKEVRLVIGHPHYRASETLSADVRRSLAEDLREPQP
ncbi:MAG TPA: DUF3501 family protein [Candidatus Binatia bacterium]|nr:DUF3501 family protein [Candidatus Binatia bacterium]